MFPDFSLLVFEWSDSNRKFHSIFLAIIYEETFVMLSVIFDKFTEICKEQNVKQNLTSLTADMAPQFEYLIAKQYLKTKRLHCWFHVKNAMMKDVEKLKTLSDLIIWDLVILKGALSNIALLN